MKMNGRVAWAFISLTVLVFCMGMPPRTVVYAQTEASPTPTSFPLSTPSTPAPSKDTSGAESKNASDTRSFAGLSLGVGLSVTIDMGKNDRVQDAEVVDGVVRVKKKNKAVARVMLETHYFFTPCARKLRDAEGKVIPDREKGRDYQCDRFAGLEEGQYGIGPFIALQPGTNEIIEAIGGGLMVGLKRKDKLGSFNLGVGFVVDPSVKVLGTDIKENQPLPGNEKQVRFREKTQGGMLILASFSF